MERAQAEMEWVRQQGDATGETLLFYQPAAHRQDEHHYHHGPSEGGTPRQQQQQQLPPQRRGWRTARSSDAAALLTSGRNSASSDGGGGGGGGGSSYSTGRSDVSERELAHTLASRRMARKYAAQQGRLAPGPTWDPPAAGIGSGLNHRPSSNPEPTSFHRQHPITNFDVFNSNGFQPKSCQPSPVRQTSYLCGRT